MDFDENTLYVGTVRDISARKKMELSLQQAYQNLEEFTAVASHDLKSPLRGIADLVQWIAEDLGSNITDSIKHNLERVQTRVLRLERLIENLLLYSRMDKSAENVEAIDPKHLVEEIIEIMSVPDNFNIKINGNVSEFSSTRTPLETTLRNLIDNAVRHHDSNFGTVNISIYKEENFCVFEISDDGPGIPKNAEERIFKLFQTLSKTKLGTGLGLAVCKRMAESHGGTITLKANAMNARGSTFCVRWPMNY